LLIAEPTEWRRFYLDDRFKLAFAFFLGAVFVLFAFKSKTPGSLMAFVGIENVVFASMVAARRGDKNILNCNNAEAAGGFPQ
jgi:hypothetical protein